MRPEASARRLSRQASAHLVHVGELPRPEEALLLEVSVEAHVRGLDRVGQRDQHLRNMGEGVGEAVSVTHGIWARR